MMKKIEMLNIPILLSFVPKETNPTNIGPNKAANFPSMLYIPKYSECLLFGISLAK